MPARKVLLIEDDVDMAELIAALLISKNYLVEIAFKGTDALRTLEKYEVTPDLILLDLTLPDMPGFDVCKKIRVSERFRAIPIVIISARDAVSDKVEGLYLGADDYITKPFNNDELLARMEAVLRRNQFLTFQNEKAKAWAVELKRILEKDSIVSHFQPIFDIQTPALLGLEAVSRLAMDSSLSRPEDLLQVALDSGLNVEVEMLCWKKAILKWKEAGMNARLFLSCSPYLVEKWDNDFLKENIDSQYAVLQITEREAMKDHRAFFNKLNMIKHLGFGLAIDNIGHGYASLETIIETRPHFVKLDVHLVRNVHSDFLRQNVVQAIVYLCHKAGIVVIGEGIEKREELRKLIELGVDAGQGSLLGAPSQEITVEPAIKF